ncbi:MAG TPA: hypothetical protein VFK80_01805 [Limnochordia bacterium]|nr:hypothetical protein [Limnochordia bacterium]
MSGRRARIGPLFGLLLALCLAAAGCGGGQVSWRTAIDRAAAVNADLSAKRYGDAKRDWTVVDQLIHRVATDVYKKDKALEDQLWRNMAYVELAISSGQWDHAVEPADKIPDLLRQAEKLLAGGS